MFKDTLDVVIADDDEASLKILDIYLKMDKGLNVVGRAVDGKQLIDVVNEKEPDLVVVDINMPELNGFEAIKECMKHQPDLVVIFVTGIKEYATKAFEINAVDYILKPLEHGRLQGAIEKAREKIFSTHQIQIENKIKMYEKYAKELPKTLLVRSDSQYSILLIPLDEIIFIEKEKNGRKVFIHTTKKVFETYDNVAALLNKLDFRFIQTHRSFIANVSYIREIVPNGAVYKINFKNYDQNASISKSFILAVVAFIEDYMSINNNEEPI